MLESHSPSPFLPGLDNIGEKEKSISSSSQNKDSMYEEDGLILDEGDSIMMADTISANGEPNQEYASEDGFVSSLESNNQYNSSIHPAVHANQLTPSVSLTPISHTSAAQQPVAKHNLPATAMMTSSISPKPSAKKPSKQSKLAKSVSSNQISRPVLRPNDMTSGISCNIHCELANGFPALNCHNCQVLNFFYFENLQTIDYRTALMVTNNCNIPNIFSQCFTLSVLA